MAKEATEVVVSAFYDRGVADTKTCLAEEVVVVCKDYVTESWGVAMDQVGSRSPCRLLVEEDREYLLPRRYSRDSEHGSSYQGTPYHPSSPS